MRLALCAAVLAATVGCAVEAKPTPLSQACPAVQRLLTRVAERAQIPEPVPQAPDCDARIAAVRAEPGLPGTPKLDQQRAQIVARSKGEPVVFVEPPQWPKASRPEIEGYRRTLLKSRFPWDTVDYFIKQLAHAPQIARQVLLRDGYLYAETGDLSWSLWQSVELSHVFNEPKLVIERGAEELQVQKGDAGYVYASGVDGGKPARLLLFDRVRVAGEPKRRVLHRDVRSMAHLLAFDSMSVLHRSERHLLAEVRYDEVPVTVLFQSDGARLTPVCERFEKDDEAKLQTARAKARVRARVLAVMRNVILEQVREQLPFDEPKSEWGQQDGHLKRYWKSAYLSGEDSFVFNFDRYPVFSNDGKPTPPQVCIDFITETFERSAGNWWQPQGQPRARTAGALSFDELMESDRRQVPSFVAFAQERAEWFDVYDVPTSRRLPYLFKQRFYKFLHDKRARMQPGDIVVIRGLAPWDHFAHPHYHTFFVYERDPITAVPILLAGNAGKPRIQSWEAVMSRTPHRKIEHVVHPRLAWLDQVVQRDGVGNVVFRAPPLTADN
jgi:hypothetical protein